MTPIPSTKTLIATTALCALGLVAESAQAMIPVIDIAALQQLLQEVNAWQQQLRGMEQQINQLQQTYGAMTGSRGMQLLLPLSAATRNYLPPDWATLEATLSGASSAYAALAAAVRSQLAANAVLTPADLGRFSVPLQTLLQNERQAVAGTQAFTRLAYAQSSDRFTSLQTLINTIGATVDAKSIAELQGRTQAELAMLTDESVKLATLAQVVAAETAARDLARREQVVANHGAFAARFQPSPPAP
jgi:type IV secretion system protein VirB5